MVAEFNVGDTLMCRSTHRATRFVRVTAFTPAGNMRLQGLQQVNIPQASGGFEARVTPHATGHKFLARRIGHGMFSFLSTAADGQRVRWFCCPYDPQKTYYTSCILN
jgi:hypothetical protein